MASDSLAELWDLVKSIPSGKVSSYGDVGRALAQPTSGYQVGRWMAGCPAGVPWWRVVSKDGRLPVWKRDPQLALEQRRRLEEEGVAVDGDSIDMARFGFEP